MHAKAANERDPITTSVEMETWTDAEIDRLKAAIRKLEGESVPDFDLIAAHKRVLAAVEKLRATLPIDRRFMSQAK